VRVPLVLLHHRSGGDFLGPFAVTPGLLGARFDVFVFTLFFTADAAKMLSLRHIASPLRCVALEEILGWDEGS
jgi:hypothetical protein